MLTLRGHCRGGDWNGWDGPMKRKELSVAIIGGGIGGLSAALSLLRAGLDVHVYERAKKLSEVGAGIQVNPNASRILHGLGLADALANMGVKPLAIHQRAGTTDGLSFVRRSAGGKLRSDSRITRCIAPTFSTRWRAPYPQSACILGTALLRWSITGTVSRRLSRTAYTLALMR